MKISCHRNFSLNRTEIQFHKPQRDSKYYLPMIFRYLSFSPCLKVGNFLGSLGVKVVDTELTTHTLKYTLAYVQKHEEYPQLLKYFDTLLFF